MCVRSARLRVMARGDSGLGLVIGSSTTMGGSDMQGWGIVCDAALEKGGAVAAGSEVLPELSRQVPWNRHRRRTRGLGGCVQHHAACSQHVSLVETLCMGERGCRIPLVDGRHDGLGVWGKGKSEKGKGRGRRKSQTARLPQLFSLLVALVRLLSSGGQDLPPDRYLPIRGACPDGP